MNVAALGPVRELWLDDRRSIRYLVAGSGNPLLLLHTIHTQLEYFADVIPTLAKNFTVYAIDLPGHGRSSKDRAATYDEPYLRKGVIDAILRLDLDRLTVAGESIGAVLGLTVAANIPERVDRVIASNPYDYETRFADGARRGNTFANVVLATMSLTGIGPVFAAMETRALTDRVLRGGLVRRKSLPPALLEAIGAAGAIPHYRYVERNVFQLWRSWAEARELYSKVRAPVTLIYGSHDWSRPDERLRTARALGLDAPIVLDDVGHFSYIDAPESLIELIVSDS